MTVSREAMDRVNVALNRVTKWRSVFTGRVLGTRLSTDIESIAFRDLFEKLILLRAENSAVVAILVAKGVMTEEEWLTTLADEADELNKLYEEAFPGMRATGAGITYTMPEAGETMRGWKP